MQASQVAQKRVKVCSDVRRRREGGGNGQGEVAGRGSDRGIIKGPVAIGEDELLMLLAVAASDLLGLA